MGLVEILSAVFQLDIGFLLDVLMNNLFWVFGFIAAGYFFTDRKSFVLFGLVYAMIILLTTDIFHLVGFSVYTAVGLAFLYLARMSVLLFLEHTHDFAKHIPIAYVLVFFFTFAIAALGWI